jgi:hypothetical protein
VRGNFALPVSARSSTQIAEKYSFAVSAQNQFVKILDNARRTSSDYRAWRLRFQDYEKHEKLECEVVEVRTREIKRSEWKNFFNFMVNAYLIAVCFLSRGDKCKKTIKSNRRYVNENQQRTIELAD